MAGSLPSDWSVTTLGDCASWYSGGTPRTSVAAYWDGDIPWITASSLQEFYIRDSERLVTQLGLENGTRLMPANSILFVVRGMSLKTEFRVGIARRPVAFGQDCKAIVANPGIDPLYLANTLRAKSTDILGLVDEASHGTGRLQTSALQQLEILVPPLAEQQAIACILGALDDKIELNRRMNQTLEGIAAALFKSWFVDFDPVRAKAAGEPPPGLASHIADLFPDEFEESELGEIPKGWRVGTLSDLVTNVIERAHPSAFTESIPYVPIGCISPRTICLSESLPGSDARSSLILFKSGDILFGAMRPYFHKVCIAPFDGTTRTTAFVLRPEESELGYAAFVVSRDETIDYATAHSEGSTIPYAKWAGSLELFPITLPPRELRQGFHDLVEPIIHKLMGSVVESHTLAAVRDTLLPKLISGELRVPDAEHFVGEGRQNSACSATNSGLPG